MLSLKEKLEHNKKIVKRFEYELEIGVFNRSPDPLEIDNSGRSYYLHSNSLYVFYPFIDCDRKGKCFIKVLEKLGYRFNSYSEASYTTGLMLYKGIKQYGYLAVPRFNRIRNQIPDYILDYIEHPVLDTIKERLGLIKSWIKKKLSN